MHSHNDLRFAAKVAATPLPSQDHPEFDTLLRAQAQAELKRREVRESALVNLYVFATSILGYSDFYEPLHRPLCDFTQRAEETLTLIPRGTFKSTVSSVSYPLWLLVKWPDTRILLCNSGLRNPRKWVKEMTDHLTTNVVMRWVFPESCPAYEDVEQFGYTEHFTVPNRTLGCPWGESSVEISSVKNSVVSRHYEVIIFDDLVDEENSRTMTGLERVSDYYQNAQALLQLEFEDDERTWAVAPVHTKVIGTRWHYSDLYSALLERDVPSMVRKAIEAGDLIFPTALSHETLDKHRKTMGSAKFSAQYMNEPIDADAAIFKREFTSYFEDVDERDLNIAITVDLAIDEKRTADESAIVVTGVSNEGELYVLDYESGRWPPSKVVAAVYRLFKRWRANFVYFESNNYQKAFAYILHEEGKKRGHFLPVRPVRSIGKKYTRIVALQPFHEDGRLLIRRSHTALEDQLHRYPKVRHDDLVDALSMRIQRMVWAEALGAPGDDIGEWSFAAMERELDERDATTEAGEAPLINPTNEWRNLWPE